MNVGLIPLAIATIGAAYGAIMLKAPQRRDNLVFGVLVLVDASMTAWRGVNVLTGGSIISKGVLVPCTIGTIALVVLSIEFAYAFPRRPPMRWRWRAAMIAWGVAAIALALVNIDGPWKQNTAIELGFFAPATLLVFALILRASRLTQQTDARIVLAMLAFRWAGGFFAYFIAPPLGVFEQAAWVESTVGSLLAFVVIGTAVLRTELFSTRSAMSEVVTIASIAMLVIFSGGAAIWAARELVPPGQLQDIALFGATLVPVALAGIAVKLYPRVESALAGLDERRARRLGVQGDPLPADAHAAIAEATARISRFGDGSAVKWVPAAQLPSEVAEGLRAQGMLRRDEDPTLPTCLAVPALGAESALVGAFYIDNGTLDRDTYLVARDLAARVALAVERHQAVSALEDARRLAELGQFAAAIAHDIRTPLTSISLNVQILRRKLQLSDDDREHLDIALEELARLDKSVAEILDFAKPVKLAAEEIDVGDLIEDAAKGLSPVLSERGVALEATAPSADLTIHGDPQRLRQVLENLVGNAADASERGAKVLLRAVTADDGRVAIEVEDRGRGIGADDLPRIFEPFFTTRPDGTGLGLASCLKVVRAHGGDIRVRSAVGEGSTFTVTLPAA